MEILLRRTAELAAQFVRSLPDRHVGSRADVDDLRRRLAIALPEGSTDPAVVIEDLARDAEPGIVASAGPRYFGFVIGGTLPSAMAADWLTSAWDQNAGIYAAGPAASVVEEAVRDWLLELLDLPRGSGVGLVTGCQMAHFTCLSAARNVVLERAGWSVAEDGLFGAPEIDVMVSTEAHASVGSALGQLGLGRARVIPVDTDAQGRMSTGAFEVALPRDGRPLIVCLQAGNVNTGAFDPFDPIIDLARARSNTWVHVDGAFGLWARVSPTRAGLATGADRADSWAADGHKWLNVPYDCGYAIIADPVAHRAAISPPTAAYIEYGQTTRDPFDWVPEYSRRARGFATYAAIRALGRSGVRDLVDRGCHLTQRMADRLGATPGVEVLAEVVLNQMLVRFHPDDDGTPDALTRDVITRVQDDGTCWVGGTTWHDMAAMRISVSNWSTTAADIDRSADAMLRCFAAARSAARNRAFD